MKTLNNSIKTLNYIFSIIKALPLIALLFCSNSLYAMVLTLDPNSDGSIYTCPTCNNKVSNSSSVVVSSYIQGVLKFSTDLINSPVESALLSLNPYSLPLHDKTMDVYGYGTNIGVLTSSDGNAGTYLGTWVIPENLLFHQETFFDVTDFINSLGTSFAAFNLRTDSGPNSFSSLEYNYGKPAQLYITTTVNEPSTLLLISLGIFGLLVRQYSNKT